METRIAFIKERKQGWPARAKGEGLPAYLPQKLRAELADLLDGLGLPENASLEDVMLRLRRRSGVLSPLETNLLFLDEWRKLYKKTP